LDGIWDSSVVIVFDFVFFVGFWGGCSASAFYWSWLVVFYGPARG
jgi:hypothetical protein